MTTTKLTPSFNWIDAPIKSEKWKNLWFDKWGKSYPDVLVFSSIEEALADIARTNPQEPTGDIYAEDLSWHFPSKNYSHTIQIPWRDQ